MLSIFKGFSKIFFSYMGGHVFTYAYCGREGGLVFSLKIHFACFQIVVVTLQCCVEKKVVIVIDYSM